MKDLQKFVSTDGTYLVWLPQLLEKNDSVYSIKFETLWKENFLCTPSPLEICLFQTLTPLGISMTFRGVGRDIIFLEQLLHISVQHESNKTSDVTRLFWLCQDGCQFWAQPANFECMKKQFLLIGCEKKNS